MKTEEDVSLEDKANGNVHLRCTQPRLILTV